MELTKEQFAAVHTDASRVVVVGCCGGGKTRVITERIKYLLSKGVMASDIYAITYTNNAAQEMISRIGEDGHHMFIGTIHSLANQILRKNGISTDHVIDEEDFNGFFELIQEHQPQIDQVPYLLIDEFQDICENEHDFIFYDLRPQNFFIAGDSRQAIYGFKGANFKLFQDLINDEANTVYTITQNYRSYPEIIEFADKFLRGMKGIFQTPVSCTRFGFSTVSRREYELSTIGDLIEKSKDEYKDWFVLARKKDQVDEVIRYLKRRNIPVDSFRKSEKTFEELQAAMKANTVKAFTIHSAKGLEAKNVIVIGAHGFSKSNEERRIAYVAATRAKDRLYWLASAPSNKNKKGPDMVSW